MFIYKQSPIQAVDAGDEIRELRGVANMIGNENLMQMRDPVPVHHKFTIDDTVSLERIEYSHPKYNPRLSDFLGREGKVKTIHYNEQALLHYTVEFPAVYPNCVNQLEDIPEEWLIPAKKYWSGKVVCIESHTAAFTVGKVYSVDEGYITDNTGTKYWRGFPDYGLIGIEKETIMTINSTKFIEFKGE